MSPQVGATPDPKSSTVVPRTPLERSSSTSRAGTARQMADWSARADDPSFQTDLRVALTSAIGELPADYRTVLVLRDVEGLSTLEVADALSIGVSSVKSRVHRARLFLRKRLGDALTTRDGDEACAVGATHGACRTRSHSRREHARRRGIDGR